MNKYRIMIINQQCLFLLGTLIKHYHNKTHSYIQEEKPLDSVTTQQRHQEEWWREGGRGGGDGRTMLRNGDVHTFLTLTLLT